MRSKKAIYNISTNLILQIIVIIYGFIVPKLIIKTFGSNVNGLISSIGQFLGYITLLEAGFGPVVKSILYKPIAKKDKKTIEKILKASEKFFRVIAKIFIIYLIILSLIYPIVVNNEFEYFYTISLIIIISISTFAEYYFGMTYKLYLQANQKTYVISLIQIFTYILSITIIILLIKLKANIQIIKLFSGIIFVIRPLLQNLYVKKKYQINLKEADSNYKIEQKWDGLSQHIAAVIHNGTDVTILTFLSTLKEVSVYSVYYMVVKGVKQLIQSFTNGVDSSFGDMIAKNEHDNLNKKFSAYEVIYSTIITIAFTCSMILIVPFIKVYTRGITDANYIRPLFGYLIVIGEYIWAIRLPYSSITLAAGHFKETRKGAWLEAITNIVVSVVLVSKYGIIGVAIGTLLAMTIRTVEFIYHTNKYILKRSVSVNIKRIILMTIETITIIIISKFIPLLQNISYLNWIINASIILLISLLVTLTINFLFYKKEYIELLKTMKNILKRKKA